MIGQEALGDRFTFHAPPTAQRKELHERIRTAFLEIAAEIDEKVPDGREKSIVMTKLEEAMFWSNAAVARQRQQ